MTKPSPLSSSSLVPYSHDLVHKRQESTRPSLSNLTEKVHELSSSSPSFSSSPSLPPQPPSLHLSSSYRPSISSLSRLSNSSSLDSLDASDSDSSDYPDRSQTSKWSAPSRLSSISLTTVHELPSPSSVSASSSHLSPLAQLKAWLANPSGTFTIEGGIPAVKIHVRFESELDCNLEVPVNMTTREKFLLFLAANAKINPFERNRMCTTGKIYAVIEPLDCAEETTEFFRIFVDDPYAIRNGNPPPPFVQPVSAESIANFQPQFSEDSLKVNDVSPQPSSSLLAQVKKWITRPEYSLEPFILEGEIPQDSIRVTFQSRSSSCLKIPPNMKTREEFILFLATEVTGINVSERTEMLRTGEIPAVIEPMHIDSEMKEFFEIFVSNPATRRGARPSFVQPIPAERIAAFVSGFFADFLKKHGGGVPQIDILVSSVTQSGQVQVNNLKIPPGITTREEFLMFLAKQADICLDDLNEMFGTGRVHGSIKALTSDQEIVKCFNLFCFGLESSFIQPVSAAAISAFVVRYPSKCFEGITSIAYRELPPITIFVKFPGTEGQNLQIPDGITSKPQFLDFLDENAEMTLESRELMYSSGQLLDAIIQPIDTDQLVVDFFKNYLRAPIVPTPLFPPMTIGVKFPGSKEFFLKIPIEVRTKKQLGQCLVKAAAKAGIPSDIKDRMFKDNALDVALNLWDTDSRCVKRFERLTRGTLDGKFSIKPLSAAISLHPQESKPSIQSHPTIVSKSTVDYKPHRIKFMEHPVELPQVSFEVLIGYQPDVSGTPFCSLQVPPKINSLEAFKIFIKERLVKLGREVPPDFSIWHNNMPIRSDFQLKEIFSKPSVALHICGTTKLVAPKTNLGKRIKAFVKEIFTGGELVVLPVQKKETLPVVNGPRTLPKGSIEIILPWTLSGDDWDFSDCHLAVEIDSEIRSLDAFKLFLQEMIPTLGSSNFAGFDIMHMKGDTWRKIENTDQLMLYFKDIQKHGVPLFACVERKLPEPDLSQLRLSEPEASHPKPVEESGEPIVYPMFEGEDRFLQSEPRVRYLLKRYRKEDFNKFIKQPESQKMPLAEVVAHFKTTFSRETLKTCVPKKDSPLSQVSTLPRGIPKVFPLAISFARLDVERDVKRSLSAPTAQASIALSQAASSVLPQAVSIATLLDKSDVKRLTIRTDDKVFSL